VQAEDFDDMEDDEEDDEDDDEDEEEEEDEDEDEDDEEEKSKPKKKVTSLCHRTYFCSIILLFSQFLIHCFFDCLDSRQANRRYMLYTNLKRLDINFPCFECYNLIAHSTFSTSYHRRAGHKEVLINQQIASSSRTVVVHSAT
jgi:hypothetical protein